MKIQNQTSIKSYKAGGFIGRYQRLIKDVVIPYQYSVLCDQAPDTEKSHVVQNFINAGRAIRGEDTGDGFYGMVFQDSDAAKWIEAAAYSLSLFPDKELEKTVDQLIDIIADAQDADGYLNTYYTIKDKDKRWTNLQEGHELYCSGHMMEAACAYYEAVGKEKLLQVMQKNAEHIYHHFITEGHEGCPGHPEVELALLKMYRLTNNRHCLELAEHFINTRGVNPHFYEEEKEKRGWSVWNADPSDTDYLQASRPLLEQKDAVGHAVRAVYLYTAMADLASSTDDASLLNACRKLWESITKRRMYLTGGIGSTGIGEAFTVDYDLPNDTAYAETCASIGLMFFASRMLENEVDGEYGDICERAFYNTVLAGMQLDGRRFFYVNPLEVIPGISGVAVTHKHDLPVRPKWYACACCPPNVARLISSFGKYAYGENSDTAFCHMFADGEVVLKNGMKFTCKTGYPYDFTITYQIEKGGKLAVRIPAWSKTWQMCKNNEILDCTPQKGYLYITAADGDTLKLTLDDTPRFQYASSKVPKLTGKTAIRRGPLVYCFEGVDNENDILSLSLKQNGNLVVSDYEESLLNGCVTITADAYRREDTNKNKLYFDSDEVPNEKPCKAVAVPYYTWGNRGENQMRVWMEESR
ncbi:MAG: glycoside hydrolase family 127 protein [Bacillus sp. (in: Bacteria)]|nr:glycoside hydrolase family 127 protein [Bacillus sp. (in: firmicutes)]MCM1428107.1 glycoside hydrolase family 127 protein [Eubacterium sp.]